MLREKGGGTKKRPLNQMKQTLMPKSLLNRRYSSMSLRLGEKVISVYITKASVITKEENLDPDKKGLKSMYITKASVITINTY